MGATGGDDPMLEVRAFAASVGIAEDPVTGSLQASAAQWLMDAGSAARYVAAQGRCIGRDGHGGRAGGRAGVDRRRHRHGDRRDDRAVIEADVV